MKKDYIIPTIFVIKYEEESKLLGNLSKAASDFAASDVHHNAMDSNTHTGLNTDNTGSVQEGDYAKKTDWLFDDNAFSDSW